MQINANFSYPSYIKDQTMQYLKDADMVQKSQPTQDQLTQDANPTSSTQSQRQTYGLMVLELMSDEEYRAFLRATAEMSEGEKIMAAQSLYRLTEFYQGKLQANQPPFNPYDSQSQFLQTFQNAYNSILNS